MDENLSERWRLVVEDEEESNPLKSISYKESWTNYLLSFFILFKSFLLTVLPMIYLYLFLLYLTYNTLLKHEQSLSFSLYSYLHPLIALRVLYLAFLCPSVKGIYKSDYSSYHQKSENHMGCWYCFLYLLSSAFRFSIVLFASYKLSANSLGQ